MQTKNDMITTLEGLLKDHPEIAQHVLNASDGDISPPDLLIFAILNRSASLIKGFSLLVQHANLISATPLLRLQVDNLLRFHAVQLVDDPDDFSTKVMNGAKIANIKDRTNHLLTDRYLVDNLSVDYPRLKKVYDDTSGFVHLSNKHIGAAIKLKGSDGRFEMKLDGTDSFDSEYPYLQSIAVFTEITQRLLFLIYSWGEAKAHFRSHQGLA